MVLCEKTTETIFFGLNYRATGQICSIWSSPHPRKLSRCPKVLLCYSFVTGKAKGGKNTKQRLHAALAMPAMDLTDQKKNKPFEGVMFTCTPLNIFHALLFVVALLFSLSSTILVFLRKASTFSFLSQAFYPGWVAAARSLTLH